MSSKAKQSLPDWERGEAFTDSAKSRRYQLTRRLLYSFSMGLLLLGIFFFRPPVSFADFRHNSRSSATVKPGFSTEKQDDNRYCPQADPLSPKYTTDALENMDQYLLSEAYANISADLLSKSIAYQTISFDNMSDPDFPLDHYLYEPFEEMLQNFVFVEFPNFKKSLTLKRINQHSLVFIWHGSSSHLRPTVLMAHTDVVPVEEATISDWTFDPWSGTIADGRVWGRGSFDTKHTFVAILQAIEALLNADFVPKRTVVLAFGHDEEIGGARGGVPIAGNITELYSDGAAVVIDEGSVQVRQWGSDMVILGVTEKGWMPVNMEIRTPGGHASQPTEHTGIGIMSQIVVGIENYQFYTYLSEGHPLLELLTCGRQHAEDFPSVLKPLLDDRLAGNIPPIENDTLALEFVNSAGALRNAFLWSTTTAKSVNVIHGGSKVNSLPEHVQTNTDIRIHVAENTTSTRNAISGIAKAVAEDHNLAFIDFDEPVDSQTPDFFVRVWTEGFTEPSKISPFQVIPGKDTPWSITAGTSRNVLGSDIIITPGMSPGNTDARWYSNVSEYIYRYSPGSTLLDSLRMHTVDESMSVQGHVAGIRWYSEFIRNMDGAIFEQEERR